MDQSVTCGMGNESHMLSRLDEDGPGTKTKQPKATRL
jgi:hypothetical protein